MNDAKNVMLEMIVALLGMIDGQIITSHSGRSWPAWPARQIARIPAWVVAAANHFGKGKS